MKVLPRRRRAVLLNSVLGLVLVAGAGAAYAAVNEGSSAAKTTVKTATVAQGTVTAQVSGSGSLVSPSNAGVNFVTGGTLTEVDVAPGDKVTAGEVLAKVDPTSANETLSTDQATLASAQANLTSVEAGNSSVSTGSNGSTGNGGNGGSGNSSGNGNSGGNGGSGNTTPTTSASYSRKPSPGASAKPSASPSSGHHGPTPNPSETPSDSTDAVQAQPASFVEDAATPSATPTVNPVQLADAEEQVTEAQNAVDAAQRAVAGTVITAPVSGTVASVAGAVGQTVSGSGGSSTGSGSGGSGSGGSGSSSSSSSSSSTPTGFVVITNPTGMEVSADFSEADALKLQAGQSATVSLNAVSGSTLNAKVLSISSLPVASSGSGSSASSGAVQYAALLAITSDTTNLRTGLSASVQVTTGEADNALYVPTTAITGTGAASTVTVEGTDGTTTRQNVVVGVMGNTDVQIVSGLTLGQKVVLTVVSAGGSNGFPSGGFPGGAGGGRAGGGVGGGLTGGGRG